MDQEGLLDLRACRASQDLQACQDHLAPKEEEACQVPRVTKEILDLLADLVSLVLLDFLVCLELRGQEEKLVPEENLE